MSDDSTKSADFAPKDEPRQPSKYPHEEKTLTNGANGWSTYGSTCANMA